jgi:hypothetical protein
MMTQIVNKLSITENNRGEIEIKTRGNVNDIVDMCMRGHNKNIVYSDVMSQIAARNTVVIVSEN